jgi:hypothetical protein
MLIYLVQDAKVDEQNDVRIWKSGLFLVAPNTPHLTIDTPIDYRVIDDSLPRDKVGTISVPMHVAFVILPSSIRTEQISKIYDAVHLGGAVATINGFALFVNRKVVKVRAKPQPSAFHIQD